MPRAAHRATVAEDEGCCRSQQDGTYLEDPARDQHLGGDQWGMMNETCYYPGQAWLWFLVMVANNPVSVEVVAASTE